MTESRSGSSSVGPEVHRPSRVLLDTNALLLPFTRRLDLEAEVRRLAGPVAIRVPSSVRAELERLVARDVRFARAARAWAERFPTSIGPGRGDEAIVSMARRSNAWVVTGDRALRDRLLLAGVVVLEPRSGGKLGVRTPRPASSAPRRATVMKRAKLLGRPRRRVRRAAG